jgi:hypothetical protein
MDGWIVVTEAHLTKDDIIYRYGARDTSARPLPNDSDAALRRLNEGNADFAALLNHVNDESRIQRIISVGPQDLGFASDIASNPGYRQALIETAIVTNAVLSAYSIHQQFIATKLQGSQVAYGLYILETRELWAPRSGNIKGTGLAPAPCDPAEFADFGNEIIKSERNTSCVKSGMLD